MHNPDRTGMTLFELMIAIVIGTGVLLAGRVLLDQVTQSKSTIAARSQIVYQQITAEQMLREIVRNMDPGTGDSAGLIGTERDARFRSWCDSASGLRGRCRVILSADTTVRITHTLSQEFIGIRKDSLFSVLRYLSEAQNGGRWVRAWTDATRLPLAIGIVTGTDTTVLRIGNRS